MPMWSNVAYRILTSSTSLQDVTLTACAKDLCGEIEAGMERDRNGFFNTFPVLAQAFEKWSSQQQSRLVGGRLLATDEFTWGGSVDL